MRLAVGLLTVALASVACADTYVVTCPTTGAAAAVSVMPSLKANGVVVPAGTTVANGATAVLPKQYGNRKSLSIINQGNNSIFFCHQTPGGPVDCTSATGILLTATGGSYSDDISRGQVWCVSTSGAVLGVVVR